MNTEKKVTQTQINAWKEQHQDIYMVPVADKVCYIRAPKMQDWKRSMIALQKNGDIAFAEEMLSALWLGGDPEIKTLDEYFLPLRKELTSLFNYDDAVITPADNRSSVIMVNHAKCVLRVITRDDLKQAEKRNPGGKPFVTQEVLFEIVCLEKDPVFEDKNNAELRFPLYQAIEQLQNQKSAQLKKL